MRVVAFVRCWLLAIAACAAPPAADPPPAADAAQRIAAAEHRWLAGDVTGAIGELAKAGGDHRAQALLARAYDLTGRPADAAHAALLAGAHAEPEIPRDVSKVQRFAISPDGAYVALVEWRYTMPTVVTVWDTLAGRVTFTRHGDVVVFGTTAAGETLAVVFGDPTGMHGVVAATGEQRWTGDIGYQPEVTIDRHGTFTTIDRPMEAPEQWDLATGKHLRSLPAIAGSVAASADGTAIVTGTLIAAGIVIDLAAKPPSPVALVTATQPEAIRDRSISPDGQVIAMSATNGTVELLGRDGRVRTSLPHAGTHVQWLDDGTLIATDGKHVTRWTAAGKSLAAFDLPPELHAIGEDFMIGAGGHTVMRRGDELVVVQLAAPSPVVIARLGLASRASELAWSADGTRLGIASTLGEVATWTAAGGIAPMAAAPSPVKLLGFDASGRLVLNPAAGPGVVVPELVEAGPDDIGGAPPHWRLALQRARVFVRDAAGEVLHFVEAPEELRKATRVGDTLVAAGVSGTIYVWNADTGAGLGTLSAGATVSALALAPDRRTLAVGRETGGIELWDLGVRKLLFTLVVAGAHWAVAPPHGPIDGDPQLLARLAGDVVVPGSDPRAAQRGLAARVLAQLQPRIAIAPTPPVAVTPRGCLPKDVEAKDGHPMWAKLTGTTLSYCLGEEFGDDAPFCFTADVTTRAVAPIASPLAVLAPREATPDVPPPSTGPSVERDATSGGVKACTRPDRCVVLPAGAGDDLAISEDGALVAVGDRVRIETWDVATGKRLARFAVPRWRGKLDGDRRPLFVGHAVLALDNPCAGPCGVATMYSPGGRALGTFPGEASEASTEQFHDDLWTSTHGEFGGFALLDTRTGAVLQRSKSRDVTFARSPDRLAVVFGPDLNPEHARADQIGQVRIYDRAGHLAAEIETPRCR